MYFFIFLLRAICMLLVVVWTHARNSLYFTHKLVGMLSRKRMKVLFRFTFLVGQKRDIISSDLFRPKPAYRIDLVFLPLNIFHSLVLSIPHTLSESKPWCRFVKKRRQRHKRCVNDCLIRFNKKASGWGKLGVFCVFLSLLIILIIWKSSKVCCLFARMKTSTRCCSNVNCTPLVVLVQIWSRPGCFLNVGAFSARLSYIRMYVHR